MKKYLLHHDHSHGGHHTHGGNTHDHVHVARDSRSLIIAMCMTGSIFIAQFIGSIYSHSLALLSDSGHMFIDLASLVIAFIGLRLALRNDRKNKFTYGWRRIEILAALMNGTILLIMCGFILWEAIQRFITPEDVHTTEMIIVAAFGLIANAVSLYFLSGSHHLTTRSAYLHVLTDLLSSFGVVIGGIVMYFTKFQMIDPIISVVITVLITRSAYMLIKRASIILMESTPEHIDITKVQNSIRTQAGVESVHDVHVWQIGSDSHAVSAHVVIAKGHNGDDVLVSVNQMLNKDYNLTHTTVQIESHNFATNQNCNGCDSPTEHNHE